MSISGVVINAEDVYTISATGQLLPNVNTMIYNQSNLQAGTVLTSNGSTAAWRDTTANVLDVKGDARFDGEITIKGVSLTETLTRIEERLAILKPNPRLEEKWSELAKLRKAYQELEADIIEKEKIVEILKK